LRIKGSWPGGPDIIEPDWPAPANVQAAFTLRSGGVSQGPYASLNLGTRVGDEASAVAENRRRVSQRLALPSEPLWLHQVHGVEVVGADAIAPASPPVADASITRLGGRVCSVLVADCMPVLFASRQGDAVGAAHAGWRGLCAGVLEATVKRLEVPPGQLMAWMGPAIGASHFEVGAEVRDAFLARDPATKAAFVLNRRGRWQCDLYALARHRLSRLGIGQISGGSWCTYDDPTSFFSHRRDGVCGRMAAFIWC
jgi:YfiH family protein